MLRTCYGHSLTKGTIIQLFYHGLDDPTQEILDARGFFLCKTPNEAFIILEDKVLLKLDFSDDSQNNPEPKSVVFADGSNINSGHEILRKKYEALATKVDSEFLKIKNELKEMRDGLKDNQALQIYMSDDTNRTMTKKEVKKDDKGMPKEPNKEWKLNEKVVPHNKEVMKEDAWRKNQLISQAYASFCVAFIIWSSIEITLPGEFRFS
nr:reverse transcriptase domain-containing protein [Tanacetum cinerariifolium]